VGPTRGGGDCCNRPRAARGERGEGRALGQLGRAPRGQPRMGEVGRARGARLGREPASRPRRGGGARGPQEKGGRARWVAGGGNAGPRERGKEKGKGKGFPILIYFLKACFHQFTEQTKNAWSGMVQQPKRFNPRVLLTRDFEIILARTLKKNKA
jgi:hypothetical protein